MPPPRPRGFASSSGGSSSRPAPNTPMSERQQMALLMQMTSSAASPSSTSSSEMSPGSSTHTPARSRDRNERGETSLHVAAIKGDQDTVKKLIESGVSPNVADFAGWTPLHEACNHAHYNVALTLVKAGANVNAKGLDDDTPLHDAATIGHLKLVKMLVEKGADINSKNRKGKTPVDIAHSSVAVYLQTLRDSPANRAAQQMKKAAEQQKKNIEESDENITNTSNTGGSSGGSAGQTAQGIGNKEEDDIYEFKSTPKDSSSGSGSEDNKLDSRKNDKRSTSEEKTSEDTTTGIGCNNTGNISVASNSSNVTTANSTGTSSVAGSGGPGVSGCTGVSSTGGSNNNPGVGSGIGSGGSVSGSGSNSSSGGGPTKRSYSDIEGHDDTSTDGDEIKKKKRKDTGDSTKESNKQGVSGRGVQSQRQDKSVKQSSGSGKSTGNLTGKTSNSLDRKSPCASPKPATTNKNTDSETETEDNKGSDSFGNNGGPKVPPLKIVIPQQNSSGDNESGSRNGKNNSTRNHPALPYVVASSSNSNDSVAADRESASSRCASPADSTGKNSTSSLAVGDEKPNTKATSEERAQQRVLRSSHRGGGQGVDRGSNNSSPQLQSSSPSPAAPNEKEDNSNISSSNSNAIGSTANSGTNSSNTNTNKNQTNTNNPSPANNASTTQNSQTESETNTGNVPSPSASSTSSTSKEVTQTNVELHPRKRKIRANKQDDSSSKTSNTQSNQANSSESTSAVNEIHPHDHPFTNCYQMYLNIRKQIEKKHKSLMPIQPRPPQGFKDYLLNRKTYALAGKTSIEPTIEHPVNLPTQMKDLFTTQEKERYKLKMQHVVEREKLGLTVEQEILRVHAKAARSLACQSLPLSACTILKDEEVYNMITPEQEEKDRNARSRYNGRLFLSWLQDVDDKWEKIKESMLLRHHNEAESLHAVQKMDWEWLMKEHSLCDYKSQPVIDECHVPMVHVSDDFDLLPA